KRMRNHRTPPVLPLSLATSAVIADFFLTYSAKQHRRFWTEEGRCSSCNAFGGAREECRPFMFLPRVYRAHLAPHGGARRQTGWTRKGSQGSPPGLQSDPPHACPSRLGAACGTGSPRAVR